MRVDFIGPLVKCAPWIAWAKARARVLLQSNKGTLTKWYAPTLEIRVCVTVFADRKARILIMMVGTYGYEFHCNAGFALVQRAGGVLSVVNNKGAPYITDIPGEARFLIDVDNGYRAHYMHGLPPRAFPIFALPENIADPVAKSVIVHSGGKDEIADTPTPAPDYPGGAAGKFDSYYVRFAGETSSGFFVFYLSKRADPAASPGYTVTVAKPGWLTASDVIQELQSVKWKFSPHFMTAVSICRARLDDSNISTFLDWYSESNENEYKGHFSKSGIIEITFTIEVVDGETVISGEISRAMNSTEFLSIIDVDYAIETPGAIRYLLQRAYISSVETVYSCGTANNATIYDDDPPSYYGSAPGEPIKHWTWQAKIWSRPVSVYAQWWIATGAFDGEMYRERCVFHGPFLESLVEDDGIEPTSLVPWLESSSLSSGDYDTRGFKPSPSGAADTGTAHLNIYETFAAGAYPSGIPFTYPSWWTTRRSIAFEIEHGYLCHGSMLVALSLRYDAYALWRVVINPYNDETYPPSHGAYAKYEVAGAQFELVIRGVEEELSQHPSFSATVPTTGSKAGGELLSGNFFSMRNAATLNGFVSTTHCGKWLRQMKTENFVYSLLTAWMDESVIEAHPDGHWSVFSNVEPADLFSGFTTIFYFTTGVTYFEIGLLETTWKAYDTPSTPVFDSITWDDLVFGLVTGTHEALFNGSRTAMSLTNVTDAVWAVQ